MAELREALVAPEHREMYRTSANFRAAIHQLAAMLPAMVHGLAYEAAKQDTRQYEAMLKAMTDPVDPAFVANFKRPAARGEESPRG